MGDPGPAAKTGKVRPGDILYEVDGIVGDPLFSSPLMPDMFDERFSGSLQERPEPDLQAPAGRRRDHRDGRLPARRWPLVFSFSFPLLPSLFPVWLVSC